jgi:hypothetical protein
MDLVNTRIFVAYGKDRSWSITTIFVNDLFKRYAGYLSDFVNSLQ